MPPSFRCLDPGFSLVVRGLLLCGQWLENVSPSHETKPKIDGGIALLSQKIDDVLGIGALAAADDAGKSDEHAFWLLVMILTKLRQTKILTGELENCILNH